MAYDMHGSWESRTGHHALAHEISADDRSGGTTNIKWILEKWISLGADPAKLNLGLGAYGRSFKLADIDENGYLASAAERPPVLLVPEAGEYTNSAGILSYYEICDRLEIANWTEVWIDDGKVPYAYGDGKWNPQWVGYDNEDSILYKVGMAKNYTLGGIMWWTPDYDDFKGEHCGKKYPLLTAAKDNWNNTIVCYYTNWSQYRHANAKFFPEDLDPSLCTHLIFAFAKIVEVNDEWSLGTTEWNDIGDQWTQGGGLYARLNRLKDSHPELKTLISVGGANHNSTDWTRMVSEDSTIESFVNNSLQFVRDNGFDGIDLNWMYPDQCSSQENCSRETNVARYQALLERFRQAIDAANNNSEDELLISATVGPLRVGESYQPEHMTDNLDFVNLMSYDMHGSWEPQTGHHALALNISSDETTNIKWILDNWIELGANPLKLHLGLATFGRSFTLANASDTDLHAPTAVSYGDYPGSSGAFTRTPGFLSYYEVCEKLEKDEWEEEWLDEGKVPYAHGRGDWVGYDNEESIYHKIEMMETYKLGGIMWWSPDLDDFKGEFCGEGKYPLMNAARNALLGILSTSETAITDITTDIIIVQETTAAPPGFTDDELINLKIRFDEQLSAITNKTLDLDRMEANIDEFKQRLRDITITTTTIPTTSTEAPCDQTITECGSWGDWSSVSTCSVTCGDGQETWQRCFIFVDKDIPHDDANCETETRSCNSEECPSWAKWSIWGPCSASCKEPGEPNPTKERYRCWDTKGNTGIDCGTGKDDPTRYQSQSRKCNSKNLCQGVCEWSPWGNWSQCNPDCNEGLKLRRRTNNEGPNVICDPEDLSVESNVCTDNPNQCEECINLYDKCNKIPVRLCKDIRYQSQLERLCNKHCGCNQSSRKRRSISDYDLIEIENLAQKLFSNSIQDEYTARYRRDDDGNRQIDILENIESQIPDLMDLVNSIPSRLSRINESLNSIEDSLDAFDDDPLDLCVCTSDNVNDLSAERCSNDPAVACVSCPVSACGAWLNWSSWTDCSKSCGGGKKSRTRQFIWYDDRTFDKTESEDCNIDACAVWGAWKPWGPCSQSCYNPEDKELPAQDRYRCMMIDGIEDCGTGEGHDYYQNQSRECNKDNQCQAVCKWNDWGEWSDCNPNCKQGLRLRRRSNNEKSEGASCTGNSVENETCETITSSECDACFNKYDKCEKIPTSYCTDRRYAAQLQRNSSKDHLLTNNF